MVGQSVAHYKVISKLGEGGMGVVYKAEVTKLERTVALKFLSLTSIGDEEKKRFKREAKGRLITISGVQKTNPSERRFFLPFYPVVSRDEKRQVN